jgi:DNA-binding transcriptional ArsR family regulator
MTTPQRPTEGVRRLDMTSLKALAHPLRVRILDTLATYGSFTASGLAERLGESSGATSYHLRQLEKHGFVRDDPKRGTARERWWERTPAGISVAATDFEPRSAGRAANDLVVREWQANRDALLGDFIAHGDELEERWYAASTLDTTNMRLTSEQLEALVAEVETITERYANQYRRQEGPGTRPVQVQLNAFPVMDAEETPLDPAGGADNVGGSV